MTIGVLDYGAGNLKNVCRAIDHLGFNYQLVSSPAELTQIDKLILPGVGAFKVAMEQLEQQNLITSIQALAKNNIPILGICLGMQLLFESSEEFGFSAGLGLIEGKIKKIPNKTINDHKLKIPHTGWNGLTINEKAQHISLTSSIENNDAVYFIHSYRLVDYNEDIIIAHSEYGDHKIPAIINKENLFGCQFHPEKSGKVGLAILKDFLT